MRRLAILAVVLALPVSVGMVRLQTARSAPPVGKAATELPKPDPALRELIGFRVRYRDLLKRRIALVRQVRIGYTAWVGARRTAVLVLPKWYGPGANPAIPLVISPHGPVVRRRRTRDCGEASPHSARSRSSLFR